MGMLKMMEVTVGDKRMFVQNRAKATVNGEKNRAIIIL